MAGMTKKQERQQQKVHRHQQGCQLQQGCQPQEGHQQQKEVRDTSNDTAEKKAGTQTEQAQQQRGRQHVAVEE
jgi:hypothetical protein